MRKSILLFLALIVVAASLVTGCGSNNDSTTDTSDSTTNNATDNGNNATDKLQEDVDKAGNAIENGVEDTADAVKYTAEDIKNDLVNAGYTIEDSADKVKDYFKGKETDYVLDNDLIRVYEYDNAADLDADIATISPDGLMINNEAIYTTAPNYYRKGNSLIVYEGSNPTYLNELVTLYGNPVIPS